MDFPVGVILGSGLNKFSNELKFPRIIFEENKSFHKIQISEGIVESKKTIIFSGRKHYYEGYSREEILQNVKFASELGVRLLIITNAAGGLNKNFRVADLMLITSHMNFLPLAIPKGPADVNDRSLMNAVRKIAVSEKIRLQCGSYCCSVGPAYETSSEIRFLNKLHVDAVGMSTVPEILQTASLGIKTVSISCITNLLTENSDSVTNHDEVVEAGMKAYPDFSRLIMKLIKNSSRLVS